MKQVRLDINQQLLQDFENLPPITTGEDWEQNLYLRMAVSRNNYVNNTELVKFTLFLIVFVSINIFLMFRDSKASRIPTEERITLLNNISEQLLINSTSLK